MLTEVTATRYVTPLREGGSLPGLVETDDLGTYVVKFRGAGQGVRALVAEVVVAGLARAVGVRVPDLAVVDLPPEIARYEADEEVQDLLNASPGRNLGIDYLPGSYGWDPHLLRADDADAAGRVLWLDALVGNVDRSWRNPNLLHWHRDLWAIDHGACLVFHHRWDAGPGDPAVWAAQPYDRRDHVLAAHADRLTATDAALRPLLTTGVVDAVLADVPDAWLGSDALAPDDARAGYAAHLAARLGTRTWLGDAA